MKILHVVKAKGDARAVAMASEHARENEVSVLLIHDAVYEAAGAGLGSWGGFRVSACRDDVEARGIASEAPLAGYEEIVQMVFDHDKVISWSG